MRQMIRVLPRTSLHGLSGQARLLSTRSFPAVSHFQPPCLGRPVNEWNSTGLNCGLLPQRRSFGIVTFNVAELGEGIFEVELLRWHKAVGDDVEEMEGVCEVQSDKAAVEISSRYSGKVTKLYSEVGQNIKTGDPLMDIEVDDADMDEASAPAAKAPASTQPSSPTASSGGNSGSTEAHAPVGNLKDVKAAPAARAAAKELGVDIRMVPPTGKGGHVTKQDVVDFREAPSTAQAASPPPSPALRGDAPPAATPQPTQAASQAPLPVLPPRPTKENVIVPITGFPKAMVKSMQASTTVPHMNIGEEMDVTELIKTRLSLKNVAEKQYNIKLTITPLVVKATSLALLKYPILNSKLDVASIDNAPQYTQFGSHNISMAIDTPGGLVVPNIKGVEEMNLMEIQVELMRLQQLALANKLGKSELTGGTATISNVGVIGGTYIHPLLFDGQAMIMGLGRTQKVPRFNSKGDVVGRDVMAVSASVDHRHIDGATVARFMAELKGYLENPETMLLQMS